MAAQNVSLRILGVDPSIFEKPTVFDLWNFRGKQKFIDEGIISLSDLTEEDINVSSAAYGLSNSERQWLQVQKAKDNDDTEYLDLNGLKAREWITGYTHCILLTSKQLWLPFHLGLIARHMRELHSNFHITPWIEMAQ